MGAPTPEAEGSRRPPRKTGEWRITRQDEIRALFQRGKRSRTAHLDVFDSASPSSHPRAAVVVPKHKYTVARRNRLKRQLREILRLEVMPRLRAAEAPTDFMIRARPEAYHAKFGSLKDELITLVERRWQPSSSS